VEEVQPGGRLFPSCSYVGTLQYLRDAFASLGLQAHGKPGTQSLRRGALQTMES
ncbi:unnamed protein product, partial [Amoebophrya sp. A120]